MFKTFIRSTSQVNNKKEMRPIAFYCILILVKATITKHVSLKQKDILKRSIQEMH